jgi:MFS family permease
MLYALRRIFGQPGFAPPEHQRNFKYLYYDIGWFGVLNGSILVFLGVYVSRIGGTPFQVGLLSAIPALVNIAVTFPGNAFARGRSIYNITRWAWLIMRLFYILIIPLPLLVNARTQIWIILGVILVMSIPGTVASVIGNAFFAETVPMEYRGRVVGTRNAIMAATTMLTTFTVGQVLNNLPLATGYTVVFVIGLVGGVMSAVQLFRIRPLTDSRVPSHVALPDNAGGTQLLPANSLRFEIWKGPFGKILLILLLYNFAVLLPGPIFPLYQVRQIRLTDQTISIASSLFWIIHFLTSTQAGILSRKLGFKKMTGIGTLIASTSTLLFMYSYHPLVYMSTQVVGGIGWSMIGSGLINYVYENVPANDRPAYLAWYNMVLNGATLVTGLVAPLLVGSLGLVGGMGLCVALRFLAGLLILFLG